MEQQKYYTPTLEDIHVGYQLEYHNWSMDEAGVPELNYDRWETSTLTTWNVETFMRYGVKGVRVPYLTEEQVIKEGWIKEEGTNYFRKNDHYLCHFGQSIHEKGLYTHLHVYHEFSKSTLYSGSCPSINEFRKIMKLLNVK